VKLWSSTAEIIIIVITFICSATSTNEE